MIHFYPIKPFSLWLSVIICGLQNIISWWRGLHYLLTCGYVVVTLSFLKSMQQEFTFEHSIIHAARDDCDWLEDKQTSQSCPDPKSPTAKPMSSPNTGRWGSGHARRRRMRNASVNRVGSCGQSCTFDVHSVVGYVRKNRRATQVTENVNAGRDQTGTRSLQLKFKAVQSS